MSVRLSIVSRYVSLNGINLSFISCDIYPVRFLVKFTENYSKRIYVLKTGHSIDPKNKMKMENVWKCYGFS